MNTTHTTTTTTFCRICESLCSLEVAIQEGSIQEIRPDLEHIATGGFACPKGLKQHRMYNSPDRLLFPLRRRGAQRERVSWDEALQGIGNQVKSIRKRFGPDSIAMYVGTAAGFSVLHPVFAQGFMDGIGSRSMFASASQDCSNKFAVAERMYGFPFTQPFPDLEHTECLIIVGANPVVSKWSFLQVPNPGQHLKDMERRGVRLYVVDPRRTETAKVAGQHVFIRPNTDVFFYLSFLHELDQQQGLLPKEQWETHFRGAEEVLALARQWPADRTSSLTQIPPNVLRQMVTDYRQANGASLYCSTGVNMGSQGSLAFWIQECINALSGNLDRRGGTLVGKGVIDFPRFGKKNGILLRPDRSRIGNFHSTNDAFPGGILADEILTPGPRQIRALFVTGGNPLITMANSNRLREAFQDLELLVTLDILPTETGHLAHYQLPCTDPLQRPDLPFIFPLMLGLQTKPYLQATRAVVPAQGEQRDEASIYLDLCRASGVSIFGSSIAQRLLSITQRWHSRGKKFRTLPQEGLLDILLRITGQGSFRKLLRQPHGRQRPAHQPGSFLGKRVLTSDGRVDLAPPLLLEVSQQLEDSFKRELAQAKTLKLITRRAVTTHNSWTHNLEDFVANERFTNYLYIHPTDAAAHGVANKDLVEVSTATGAVIVRAKLLEDLMPGTVALPHGWGHQATNTTVARQTQGVNVNILAADGPQNLEPVSGMVHLTGFPVEIRRVEEHDPKSWSGKPADRLRI